MIRPFSKTVYNCKEATLLSIKHEERRITVFERIKLDYHLLYCGPCRRFISQWKGIEKFNRDILFTRPPFSLPPDRQEKIQRQLDLLKS